MSRKFKFGIVVLVFLGFLIISNWYLFYKKYDYQYTFRAETSKGVVFQRITDWTTGSIAGIDSVVMIKRKAFSQVRQTIWVKNQGYDINWEITQAKDSMAQVDIGINARIGSLSKRLGMLLGQNPIKDNTLSLFLDFREYLSNFLKSNKVSDNIEMGKSPGTWCAYVTLESAITSKSNRMIANNAYINAFLANHDLILAGKPFIEVLHWNLDDQTIKFNFCFPVEYRGDLPDHETIKFKRIIGLKSLKIDYYGNYRYSDRAWYVLLDHAQKKNISLDPRPVEVYLNNPITDGNEHQWQAEVYMPIVDKIP